MRARPRVLVAGNREFIVVAAAVLGDAAECSLRFDDSRMFDFLGALGARPAARGVPVVCCRLLHRPITAGARRAIALALEALGVAQFVDMQLIAENEGPDAAREALRRAALGRLRGKP